MDEDKQTDKILQAADLAASKGHGAEAAALITDQATPATIRISERAAAWKPASRWGKDLQDFLVLLLQGRVQGMKAYADALRSDDLKRVVEQMEAQRKVEQNAVELDRRLEQQFPTNGIGEACDPP